MPSEFVGGTSTISNLGMYGINTVSSIINPENLTIRKPSGVKIIHRIENGNLEHPKRK